MTQRFNRIAPAAVVILMMTCGSAAAQATAAECLPAPRAFEPRQRMSSYEPARPAAAAPKWGLYAMETHKRIEKHLRANRDTFTYRSDLYVEVWIDPNGRVRRTRVTGATGNREADAITGPDFPPGLILPAPDKDLPQPIKLKMNAER